MPSYPSNPRESISPDLLSWLKGYDNPFDDYVQARHATESFSRTHVPDVNKSAFDVLSAAIARYRVAADARAKLSEEDVPRSGVVVLLGRRGAGKTHLVHALASNSDALLVAPPRYELHRPFAEYLLHQLVRWLEDEAGDEGGALFELAEWFTCQVIIQALYGMTETDWLCHNEPRWLSFLFALRGWGTGELAKDKEILIHKLNEPGAASIFEIFRYCSQRPETMRKIALRQVEATETGSNIAAQIRRALYRQLVELTFASKHDDIFDYLLDGFSRVEAVTSPSREALVEELLRALTELFILFGRPVVFAFDALETLLSDPPDEKRCHSFFRGLADVIDSHRGVPFFVFAEDGHWQQAQPFLSSYAQQRFEQGIPTRGYGSLSRCELPPVSGDELQQLVQFRMQKLLAGYFVDGIPDHSRLSPFCDEDISRIVRDHDQAPPLRQLIQTLRDRYDQLVFDRNLVAPAESRGIESTAVELDNEATSAVHEFWRREIKAAQRRAGSEAPNSLADTLHSGLESWFQSLQAAGVETNGWKPTEAANQTFGKHLAYGLLVNCRWQNGSESRRTGIAFLLAPGRGKPNDLETKLKMMASPGRRVESLLILWPRETDFSGAAHEQLPPATKAVWDRYVTDGPGELSGRVRLEAIEPDDLAPWLAMDEWESSVRDQLQLPDAEKDRFVVAQTQSLLHRVIPTD